MLERRRCHRAQLRPPDRRHGRPKSHLRLLASDVAKLLDESCLISMSCSLLWGPSQPGTKVGPRPGQSSVRLVARAMPQNVIDGWNLFAMAIGACSALRPLGGPPSVCAEATAHHCNSVCIGGVRQTLKSLNEACCGSHAFLSSNARAGPSVRINPFRDPGDSPRVSKVMRRLARDVPSDVIPTPASPPASQG